MRLSRLLPVFALAAACGGAPGATTSQSGATGATGGSGGSAIKPTPDAGDGGAASSSGSGGATGGADVGDAGPPADTLASNRDRLLGTYLDYLKGFSPQPQANGLSGSNVTSVCDLWSKLDPSSRATYLTLTARM